MQMKVIGGTGTGRIDARASPLVMWPSCQSLLYGNRVVGPQYVEWIIRVIQVIWSPQPLRWRAFGPFGLNIYIV